MSAVSFVASLLEHAFSDRASDIHLEPTVEGLRVRLRVDGLLDTYSGVSSEMTPQVIARIKVLARMDVSQKRLPQDGTFSISTSTGRRDLRISTFPSLYGEKVVIRILERQAIAMDFSNLGLSEFVLKHLKKMLTRSSGFFLVTGPTGSGKTTSLYSMLSTLNNAERNIVTLEDPIEYHLPGVMQSQMHEEIGFTFARGMRAILRQDPDVIMVGEIRDRETAEVAIQAALTGHLVLSTTHTHDSVGAVMRLLDMGIPAFMINATLSGVLSQRLVRVLCKYCRRLEKMTDTEQAYVSAMSLSVSDHYVSVGCTSCNGRGYSGRIGIFELLVLTPTLRESLTVTPSYQTLQRNAIDSGFQRMHVDAAYKIQNGITSIAECMRVLY